MKQIVFQYLCFSLKVNPCRINAEGFGTVLLQGLRPLVERLLHSQLHKSTPSRFKEVTARLHKMVAAHGSRQDNIALRFSADRIVKETIVDCHRLRGACNRSTFPFSSIT